MIQTYFDRFAISLSSICAIHCVAFPIIAGVIPLLAEAIHHGNYIHEFWFHQFILLFILPVSIFALFTGYRCHRQFTPILIGTIGLLILVSTAMLAETLISNNILPYRGETILTIVGGVIHAAGHIFNIMATKSFRASCIA